MASGEASTDPEATRALTPLMESLHACTTSPWWTPCLLLLNPFCPYVFLACKAFLHGLAVSRPWIEACMHAQHDLEAPDTLYC